MPLTNRSYRIIGWLLILCSVLLLVPYTLLTVFFEYPDILRQPAGEVLARFHAGGQRLVWVWLAFATVGLPLALVYVFIGQLFERQVGYLALATKLGVISIVVQWIGLLRWVFVVPLLATEYVHTTSETKKEAIVVAFTMLHQFAGVLLGEHIGQLLTICWTVMAAWALHRMQIIPAWHLIAGWCISAIYLLGQSELLATVLPHLPSFDWAGFVGSTLWLLWLISLGVFFLRLRNVYQN